MQVEGELATDWQRRLRRLLRDDPSLEIELRRVLDQEWNPLLAPAEQVRIGQVQLNATASGQARVYQAGGNQTIREA